MGQLTREGAIFLSASVPDPSSDQFLEDGDSAAISAAVSALVYVTLGRRRLVWGGHPAITPMIWACAETMKVDYGKWVKLYQSEFFRDEFPEENRRFKNVVFTPAVKGSRAESLALMRQRMMDETAYSAAVFVGGMRGVLDEWNLFKTKASSAKILPIVSTGGAARQLGEKMGADQAFARNLDYVSLLLRELEIDPNENRYVQPDVQPALKADRIRRPRKDQ